MIQKLIEMEILKVGDILIMDGKPYVSMDMYRNILNDLKIANMLTESFSQRLSAIEVANENRRSMKIIKIK